MHLAPRVRVCVCGPLAANGGALFWLAAAARHWPETGCTKPNLCVLCVQLQFSVQDVFQMAQMVLCAGLQRAKVCAHLRRNYAQLR